MRDLCFFLIIMIFSFIFIPSDMLFADFEKYLYIKVWCPSEEVMGEWVNGSDKAVIMAYEMYNRDGDMVNMENPIFKTIWCGQLFCYTYMEEFYEDDSYDVKSGYIAYDNAGNVTDVSGIKSDFPKQLWDEHREMLHLDVHLELSTLNDVYYTNDQFALTLELENRAFDFTCNVYLAICTPDNFWLFFPGYEIEPAEFLTNITIPLDTKFTVDLYESVILPSFNPPINKFGDYKFAIALTDPLSGQVIENAFDRIDFKYSGRLVLVNK